MGSLLDRTPLLVKDWDHKESRKSPLALQMEAWLIGALLVLSLVAAASALLGGSPASAHPGGLAADGCHNDRKNGGRHCHRGPKAGETAKSRRDGAVYYPNCAAARAAGAAPVRRGDLGYARHLDRDNDGVGCE